MSFLDKVALINRSLVGLPSEPAMAGAAEPGAAEPEGAAEPK